MSAATAAAIARPRRPGARVLPGFGLSLGITLFLLTAIVLIPLSSLIFETATLTWAEFTSAVLAPRALAAYRLSLTTSAAAALVNAVFGVVVAWVLVRYRFPLRALVDAIVDLPFALPTAVAGLTLTALYAPHGWVGRLLEPLGIKVAFAPLGIAVALTFIGLPFVVRSVQPVLEDLDPSREEAAATLGATRAQTFARVILPHLAPAALTGATLAFARGLGEYGSVIFISGNMPMRTEIAPLLITTRLEQYEYGAATAIAVVMLGASFLLLLAANLLQRWMRRRSS